MPEEDVTKLTDEELDARIKGEEVEKPEESSEKPEETAKEETDESAETPKPSEKEAPEEPETPVETPKEEVKEPEEEPKPPSRRETLRIQDILAKRARSETPQPQQVQPERKDALDYQEALDADPEVIQRLQADRRAEGENAYRRGLEQAQLQSDTKSASSEFRTNIKIDYPLVKDKLDKLDQVDRQALDIEYLQFNGYDTETGLLRNPYQETVSYSDYVEARYEQAERLAASMSAETTKNVVKQAAQTGLRPDGSTAPSLNLNKAAEDMTDEELDAMLTRSGFGTQKR